MDVKQHRYVLIAGTLAIVGGIANGVSDYLLQGGFAPGPGVNTFENLVNVPFDSVYWGSVIGYASLPFWLLGLWPLYYALRPAGQTASLIPVLMLGFALACIPGYHHSYAFYAAGFQAASNGPEGLLTEQLMRIHTGALLVFQGPLGLSCLWIAAMIAAGKTHFSRWMFVVSPMLTPPTQPLVESLAAPWGAYIRPPWGTVIITLFFACSLWVYWKRCGPHTSEPLA